MSQPSTVSSSTDEDDDGPGDETRFVAEYDFKDDAPREGDEIRLFPGQRFDGKKAMVEFKRSGQATKEFMRLLDDVAIPYSVKASKFDPLDPQFKEDLRDVLAEIGEHSGRGTRGVNAKPTITTPVKDGLDAHRSKRRQLESWLRNRGIAYDVECRKDYPAEKCQITFSEQE